jgi:hypothetical protein
VNHDRTGNEITKAFVLAAQQHAANPHRIERRQLVDDAHQVAADSFRRRNRTAGILDDAKSFFLFSRRLAVPENFKNGEVPKIKYEVGEQDKSHEPDSAFRHAGQRDSANNQNHHEANSHQNLKQRVVSER